MPYTIGLRTIPMGDPSLADSSYTSRKPLRVAGSCWRPTLTLNAAYTPFAPPVKNVFLRTWLLPSRSRTITVPSNAVE
jgi:hypothetical protein